MFDRKKYKQFARIQLKGRWKVPVLMTLIALVLTTLFSLPEYINYPYKDLYSVILNGDFTDVMIFLYKTESTASNTPVILPYIELFVTLILSFVAARIYIKLSQSPDKISFSDYLQNFNLWGRGILVGLWQILWIMIWCLTVVPVIFILSFIMVLFTTPQIIAGGDINEILMAPSLVLTFIAIILFLIVITIKSLSYSMTWLIAAEHEKCTVRQALNISKIITKGYKWELFKMFLSFIGWYILNILTLKISSIWVKPYISMTKVNAYHSLLKNAFEENLIHVEDFEE